MTTPTPKPIPASVLRAIRDRASSETLHGDVRAMDLAAYALALQDFVDRVANCPSIAMWQLKGPARDLLPEGE